MTEKHKICFKCGESKPLSAFYKHPRMADGRVNKCKECNKIDVRQNRKDKVDYYREYDNKRSKDIERYSKQLQYACSYRSLNKHKKAAQSKLRNALISGKIKAPSNCEYCGKQHNKLNGHHSSYAEDMHLLVTWLCPSCHSTLHRHFENNIK